VSEASIIVVPGMPATVSEGLPAWAIEVAPVVLAGLGIVAAWVLWSGRRRRLVDPRELAFRRLTSGLGRREVRALRREAAARGLPSPVGLAMSPALIEQAVRRQTPAKARA
jgi:membrane protein implicated in regulation of membrane protease activity